MRTLIAAVLCLFSLPAAAQSLQGQWGIEQPSRSGTGIVLIDAEGRVTWDVPNDNGRQAKFRGYVSKGEADGIKIVVTNGRDVSFVYCAHETADKLHCYASRTDGKSAPFFLARVGPGPTRLTQAPR